MTGRNPVRRKEKQRGDQDARDYREHGRRPHRRAEGRHDARHHPGAGEKPRRRCRCGRDPDQRSTAPPQDEGRQDVRGTRGGGEEVIFVVPALSRDPYRVVLSVGARWSTPAVTTTFGGYGSRIALRLSGTTACCFSRTIPWTHA